MVSFIVQAFESVRAWFILFGFKIQGISLEVYFITPCKMTVMFNLV